MSDGEQTERRQRRTISWWCVAVFLLILAGFAALPVLRKHWGVSSKHSKHLEAAKAAMALERYELAFSEMSQAEAAGVEMAVPVLFDFAEAAIHLGKLTDAEHRLRAILAVEPTHRGANELLCSILRVAGRHSELRPFALQMLRNNQVSQANLIALTAEVLVLDNGSVEETAVERFLLQGGSRQKDALARLSQARYCIDHNLEDDAIALLKSVTLETPQQFEAQARLGGLLIERDSNAFNQWHRNLPAQAREHPEFWMVAGHWAEKHQDTRAAARCFWETLRRHPDHPIATHRLSRTLTAVGRVKEAEIFSARALLLAQLKTYIMEVKVRPERAQQIAEILEKCGRHWEAVGWCQVGIDRIGGSPDWASQMIARLRPLAQRDSGLISNPFNPVNQVDLSSFPLPNWSRTETEISNGDDGKCHLSFVDSAKTAGIDFSFVNGADPDRAYMFEFSGGGVAVLDFDADGWPDVYLTQGCPWPPDLTQRRHLDQLYRNLGDGRFANVTGNSRIVSPGYGQGVAAGDIDNDGFQDLYIANIGRNQLYRNNGDGTFSDITEDANIQGTEWTSSVLIADLNADGQPDLCDVNYLGGSQVFTKVCFDRGRPVQCAPPQFPGEMDRVYLSSGDGHLADVSQEAGVRRTDGKGMGIVAADIDGSRLLSLFVSNDTTPNFLYINTSRNADAALRFDEQSTLRGVALSAAGKASSCMGIAAGDSNQDGLLDLFVTTFQDEPNNLFVQDSHRLFRDQIRESQLHDPGFQMEGWGAQFLDLDLDGNQDLAVANGHLDDYPHTPGVHRMPTQVFRNSGNGRFKPIASESLGPYFQQKYLGRALAKLDWNCDGRPDFCVTHLHAPFALLTNESKQTGNFLSVELRGVRSSRDAIGSIITLQVDGKTISQQLIAGDGFQASNQRHLIFGLSSAPKVDQVRIEWPSGIEDKLFDVPANSLVRCVEGKLQSIRSAQ